MIFLQISKAFSVLILIQSFPHILEGYCISCFKNDRLFRTQRVLLINPVERDGLLLQQTGCKCRKRNRNCSKQETNEHPIDSSIHYDLASIKKLHFATGLDAP